MWKCPVPATSVDHQCSAKLKDTAKIKTYWERLLFKVFFPIQDLKGCRQELRGHRQELNGHFHWEKAQRRPRLAMLCWKDPKAVVEEMEEHKEIRSVTYQCESTEVCLEKGQGSFEPGAERNDTQYTYVTEMEEKWHFFADWGDNDKRCFYWDSGCPWTQKEAGRQPRLDEEPSQPSMCALDEGQICKQKWEKWKSSASSIM